MSTLLNMVDIVEEAIRIGESISQLLSRARDYLGKAKHELHRIIRSMDLRCDGDVVTLSLSSAVADFLKEWGKCIGRVYLMESRPGNEALEALRTCSKYTDVIPIADSSMAHFLGRSNYVIIGADGIYGDGVIMNKVGTAPLLITAKELGVETIAIFESYKATMRHSIEPEEVVTEILGMKIKVPLFDKVHVRYVDVAITDLGIIKHLAEDHVRSMYGIMRRSLLPGAP